MAVVLVLAVTPGLGKKRRRRETRATTNHHHSLSRKRLWRRAPLSEQHGPLRALIYEGRPNLNPADVLQRQPRPQQPGPWNTTLSSPSLPAPLSLVRLALAPVSPSVFSSTSSSCFRANQCSVFTERQASEGKGATECSYGQETNEHSANHQKPSGGSSITVNGGGGPILTKDSEQAVAC